MTTEARGFLATAGGSVYTFPIIPVFDNAAITARSHIDYGGLNWPPPAEEVNEADREEGPAQECAGPTQFYMTTSLIPQFYIP